MAPDPSLNFSRQKTLIIDSKHHRQWPDSNKSPRDATLNCLVMLIRHIHSQNRRYPGRGESLKTETDKNIILHYALRPGSYEDEKSINGVWEKMKEAGMTAGDSDPKFADLEDSAPMLDTMWSWPEFELFHTIRTDGGEEDWKEDTAFAQQRLVGHRVIKIDHTREPGPLDIADEISKRYGPHSIPSEPGSYRAFLPTPPDYVRVRYTPLETDAEDISSLHTFDMKIICLEDLESLQYTLAAAVRIRNQDDDEDIDRIRLFHTGGFDILPDTSAPYAAGDWAVGARGHAYHLYYIRSERHFKDLSETQRASMREEHRKRGNARVLAIVSLAKAGFEPTKGSGKDLSGASQTRTGPKTPVAPRAEQDSSPAISGSGTKKTTLADAPSRPRVSGGDDRFVTPPNRLKKRTPKPQKVNSDPPGEDP
ncbi:hypothetical protein K4K52_007520 [Colletotrichum sp. SAR 10_76]|nr:hypothetical protein K4K52_007520 [Colletotrichum sp. SAR 10_76]